MPTVAAPSGLSKWAGQMRVSFGEIGGGPGYASSIPARECKTVRLCAGPSPSVAFCSMLFKDAGPGKWSEVAPTVALRQDGPAGSVILRTRAQVTYTDGEQGQRVIDDRLAGEPHARLWKRWNAAGDLHTGFRWTW